MHKMQIIDAHIHFFENPHFDELALRAGHENTEANLRESFLRNGVVRAVVMGNRDPGNYPDFCSYCVGLDSQSFDDPAEALGQVEKHLRSPGCVGLKLYPGYNRQYVSDPLYRPFLALARDRGMPVAIHTGATSRSSGMLKYSHPLTIDEVAAEWPDVQFVLCHFGNPWVIDAAAVVSKNPNVAADLSGILEGAASLSDLRRDYGGYIAHLSTWLEYCGRWDNLLYGTDWPLAGIPGYIEFVSHIVPEKHHDKVFFENANRVYQLGL